MSIIYAIIAKDKKNILCQYNTASGNYPMILMKILQKLENNQKISYNYGNNHYFHFLNYNHLTFACMADQGYQIRTVFAFLEQIKKSFLTTFSNEQIQNAQDHSLGRKFVDIFKTKINYYNSYPEVDKMKSLKNQLEQVRDVMVTNIDKILKRQQMIQVLVKKTQTMHTYSKQIKDRSRQMMNDAYWRNKKCYFIIAGVILAIGIFLCLFFFL